MNKAEIMTRIASSWVSSSNAQIDKLDTSKMIRIIASIADRIIERCPDPVGRTLADFDAVSKVLTPNEVEGIGTYPPVKANAVDDLSEKIGGTRRN